MPENKSKKFTFRHQECHISKIKLEVSTITKLFVSMKLLIFVSYARVKITKRMVFNTNFCVSNVVHVLSPLKSFYCFVRIRCDSSAVRL
jgi:hypothetical protein